MQTGMDLNALQQKLRQASCEKVLADIRESIEREPFLKSWTGIWYAPANDTHDYSGVAFQNRLRSYSTLAHITIELPDKSVTFNDIDVPTTEVVKASFFERLHGVSDRVVAGWGPCTDASQLQNVTDWVLKHYVTQYLNRELPKLVKGLSIERIQMVSGRRTTGWTWRGSEPIERFFVGLSLSFSVGTTGLSTPSRPVPFSSPFDDDDL
jgi:hypothetical protein